MLNIFKRFVLRQSYFEVLGARSKYDLIIILSVSQLLLKSIDEDYLPLLEKILRSKIDVEKQLAITLEVALSTITSGSISFPPNFADLCNLNEDTLRKGAAEFTSVSIGRKEESCRSVPYSSNPSEAAAQCAVAISGIIDEANDTLLSTIMNSKELNHLHSEYVIHFISTVIASILKHELNVLSPRFSERYNSLRDAPKQTIQTIVEKLKDSPSKSSNSSISSVVINSKIQNANSAEELFSLIVGAMIPLQTVAKNWIRSNSEIDLSYILDSFSPNFVAYLHALVVSQRTAMDSSFFGGDTHSQLKKMTVAKMDELTRNWTLQNNLIDKFKPQISNAMNTKFLDMAESCVEHFVKHKQGIERDLKLIAYLTGTTGISSVVNDDFVRHIRTFNKQFLR